MNRFIKKSIFHICKFFLKPFVYLKLGRFQITLFNKLLRFVGCKLKGEPRFIAASVKFDDFTKIEIGNRVVISSNVILLTHDYSYTTALIAINEPPNTDIGILNNIKIGDNVFIGMNTLILPGTEIGNNVIIGAGSIVKGKIKSNIVVAGNPAKEISTIEEYAHRIKEKKDITYYIDKQ